MKGRFVQKTEAQKAAWSERAKEMLKWPECEGCKKRKEFLIQKAKEIKQWLS